MVLRLRVVVEVISAMIVAVIVFQVDRIDPLNAILAAKFAIITTKSQDTVPSFLLSAWPHRSTSWNLEVIGVRD